MQNNSAVAPSLWRRITAFLYDCLLLIAIFFVVTAISIAFNGGESIDHPAYKVGLYVIAFLFFNWFWQHGGQTLGMRAWHLKLINEKPGKLKFSQCLQRFLLGTLLFGFTLLYALFDNHGRALHDRLSGTLIVYKFK